MKNWKKNSWRKYPVKHIPDYPDKKELDKVLDKIGTFPPLVFAGETRHLSKKVRRGVLETQHASKAFQNKQNALYALSRVVMLIISSGKAAISWLV